MTATATRLSTSSANGTTAAAKTLSEQRVRSRKTEETGREKKKDSDKMGTDFLHTWRVPRRRLPREGIEGGERFTKGGGRGGKQL